MASSTTPTPRQSGTVTPAASPPPVNDAARPAPIIACRGQLLWFHADPASSSDNHHFEADGLLVVQAGKIVASGPWASLAPLWLERAPGDGANVTLMDYRGKLILPGFIDTHVHYPQLDIIASPADALLPWLNQYTFPAERSFGDAGHAREVADFFLDQLFANGTTSAMVYCTVHPESVDAFFAASSARNARMIAGKVLMDRHCPTFLQDTPEQGERDSEALIARWHQHQRQLYAITPRFAPTSSPAQLQLAGEMATRHPTTFIQTHIAENPAEMIWVRELFPDARSYLDVYQRYGLLRERTMLGHGIYLDDTDLATIADTRACVAMCPTSNLFLGSGLFDIARADQHHTPFALATDVGGGTSFSMLQTMNEAYKVARLAKVMLPVVGRADAKLNALRMFYLATLGAARSLQLEHCIGHFTPGVEADFIVLDPHATPLLARRSQQCHTLEEQLFVMAILGDERMVAATWVAGVQQKIMMPTGQEQG